MEIHAPSHPTLTLKEAVVHLGIVTVGIMIALSFEGVLEWSHHRRLVRETRSNLQNEIRNNQKDIQIILKSLAMVTPRFISAIEVLNDLSTPDRRQQAASIFNPENPDSLLSGFTLAWLNTSSYSTAEVTRALGLMEYGEVRKYAELYDPQALYSRAQDAAQTETMASLTLGHSILENPTADDVHDVKRQLRLALARILDMTRFATVLNDRYSRALEDTP